ncbi:hypothetical protein QTJ16_007091 [Diplocarpon rosae]|uniref:Uncharacterized protein n=1 Tax=Diplocarpon rosae TaxID=946125 RepID=A0AAD9W9M8_9HELO|nr:hypothetical protein QTJ16_007091 [Diplocarpon rosae]
MTSLSSRALFRRAAAIEACAIPEISDGYNLPLHIGALFIILAVSFGACVFPIAAVKVPQLRIPPTFLFVVRHFGTGVLAATALVHLIPTAYISLHDPCLPRFWNETYPAMPGALCLAAIFMIVVVEMLLSPGKNCCAMPAAMMEPANSTRVVAGYETGSAEKGQDVNPTRQHRCASPLSPDPGAIHGREGSTGRQLQQVTAAHRANLDALERTPPPHQRRDINEQLYVPLPLTSDQKQKKDLTQCLLLELGILFHSVFIGMALSVATGDDFLVLLIAISFHQTFEGLALGSRIAALTWKPDDYQPWLMALAYGCTTPIGQAIGLATHTFYRPESETGLILVGVMNAISGGLLLWASLVELIMEDFLSDESWKILRGPRRLVACLLVFAGAFAMSLVGAWA